MRDHWLDTWPYVLLSRFYQYLSLHNTSYESRLLKFLYSDLTVTLILGGEAGL